MNIINLENDNRKFINSLGCFKVLEYERDLSVNTFTAQNEFFMSKMGVRRRQVVIGLKGNSAVIQAGAM